MKKLLLAGLLVLTALRLPAQTDNIVLTVQASLPFIDFVIGENVPLTVSLTNPGSTALIIDDYPPHNKNGFHLFLRNPKGRVALPYTKKSPLPECTIKPGDTYTFTINVNEFFDISEDGRYQVAVTANRGDGEASSRVIPFMIVRGIEIGKVRRIKEGSDTSALQYTLLYWARSEREYLFLKILELPSERLQGFVNLGSVVRIAEPRIEFEPDNIIVVTHQTSRDNFISTRLDISQKPVRILDSRSLKSAVAIQESAIIKRVQEQAEGSGQQPPPKREGSSRRQKITPKP